MKRLFSLLCLSSTLVATEHFPDLSPWLNNLFEFEAKASYAYQYYNSIDTQSGSFSHPSYNHFVDIGLALPFWPNWEAELEVLLVRTSDHAFGFEAFRATARTIWLDDIAGDCLSLATGAIVTIAGKRFLKDLSIPLIGEANLVGFASIGKEFFYCSRFWGLYGLGVANRGSPWSVARIAFDLAPKGCHKGGLYSDMLFGFGHSPLESIQIFSGYQNTNYHSITLAAFYRYTSSPWATFGIDYSYRIYSKNFPSQVNTLTFSLFLPFSL